MSEDPADKKFGIKTALAEVYTEGYRLDSIALLVIAIVLSLLFYVVLTHKTDAKEAAELIAKALTAQVEATAAATKAQNFQTCIMTVDMGSRERAYEDKSSWCNRVFGQITK